MINLSLFESAKAAARDGRPRVVSVSWEAPEFDPIDVFARARRRGEEAMLWQLPSEGVALVAAGVAAELSGRGPERFVQVERQWRRLVEDAFVSGFGAAIPSGSGAGAEQGPPAAGLSGETDPGHPGPGPLAVGGFAFTAGGAGGAWQGFGDGRLVLPKVVFGVAGRRRWLTFNAVVKEETDPVTAAAALASEKKRWLAPDPGAEVPRELAPETTPLAPRDDLPKERWLAAVDRVAADIRAGKLEKAVLARCVRIPLPDDFSVAAALRRLRADYPETYVFAVAREQGCFFGATPERIVHLTRGKVNVACMAGSIGRGKTEAEDRLLGETLLADAKNVEEHKIVLRAILRGLAPACDVVTADAEPGLRKFANVQHLYTPVRARAKEGVHILEFVSRIHPTPAIGGHPTAAALQLIAAEENMDRGWYAGPVGWMNARGDGEFAVGLRSGLVRDGEARLFAGCGIMGDSDPESEYAESVLKLQPMLRALEAGRAAAAEPMSEPVDAERREVHAR